MTEKEALKLLEKPEFGNPEHIKAVKYLEDLAEARELCKKVAYFPNYDVILQVMDEFGLH